MAGVVCGSVERAGLAWLKLLLGEGELLERGGGLLSVGHADFWMNWVWSVVLLVLVKMVLGQVVRALKYLCVYHESFDLTSERHGGELVAQVLQAHGVEFVFTLVGGHISPILVAAEQLGIRVIDTRHEVTAVFAADAVARLTGVPGVAAVTAGPGLTNTVTAVKNAQMAESPVVLIGGAAATLLKGRGALQDIDQMSLFKPICKWTATVTRVCEIPDVMREAFRQAREGTPGPVFVEFPIDSLYPAQTVMRGMGFKPDGSPKKPGKGVFGAITNLYLKHYLRRLFAGGFVSSHKFGALPYHVPKATAHQVEQTVQLLAKAQRPLILLGSQATLPPVKADDLRAALEGMGIPCFLGGMSRGLLGRHGKLHVRQKRAKALAEADVVIMAGIVADFRLDYGRVLRRRSKIIAVNRDEAQLKKNSDLFWKPKIAVQGDVADFIVRVAAKLSVRGGAAEIEGDWLSHLQERAAEREQFIATTAAQETDNINPLRLLQIAENALDENTILVADGGDFVGSAAYILRPRGPLRWLDPGAFGTLGVGGGFALGAKLVRPDANVVIIYGDGSCGYSVAEYDTYARHNAPVISVVGNDACWTQIAREQVPMFQTSVACDLVHNDYHVVAEGYGGKGILINDIAQAEKAFRDAQRLANEGKPVLINALIGKTKFREGSISV